MARPLESLGSKRLGKTRPSRTQLGKVLLALLVVAAGVNHVLRPALYAAIVPPYLPWPLFLVYASGALEVVLGLLLLVPRAQRLAAWGLALLLVAVFPANLHMALNPERFPDLPPVLLWLRLPFQIPLILWALRYR